MSKYRVISGLYFPVFELNTRKYGPEVTRYLDTFHAVAIFNTSRPDPGRKEMSRLHKTFSVTTMKRENKNAS